MEHLSDGHKGGFCRVCRFEARLVRFSKDVLDEIKRQLIIGGVFEDFRKKRENTNW